MGASHAGAAVKSVLVVAACFLTACVLPACSSAPHVDRQPTVAALASRLGRPIRIEEVGRGRSRLYLICGIHGDEPEGLEAALPIMAALRARPALVTARVVEDANPDGTIAGTRANAAGVDLNRNWPAGNFSPSRARGPSPLSEPESRLVHADLMSFSPDVVIVFHSTPRGPFVNFDGPGAALARVFADAAAAHDPRWHVVPDMGYPTPGSLGSLIGKDMGIPILTVELRRGSSDNTAALRAGVLAVAEEMARGAARNRQDAGDRSP